MLMPDCLLSICVCLALTANETPHDARGQVSNGKTTVAASNRPKQAVSEAERRYERSLQGAENRYEQSVRQAYRQLESALNDARLQALRAGDLDQAHAIDAVLSNLQVQGRGTPLERTAIIQAQDERWQPMAQVRAGDRVVVDSMGSWTYWQRGEPFNGPGGNDDMRDGLPYASLTARIDEGPPFHVGYHWDGVVTESGSLRFRIHDGEGGFHDNAGEVEVQVRVNPVLPPPVTSSEIAAGTTTDSNTEAGPIVDDHALGHVMQQYNASETAARQAYVQAVHEATQDLRAATQADLQTAMNRGNLQEAHRLRSRLDRMEGMGRPAVFSGTVAANLDQWQVLADVNLGDEITINATGRWSPWRGGGYDAQGHRNRTWDGMPQAALIGRFNDGPPFFVGSDWSGMARESGVLSFRINDDGTSDNSGSINVTIRLNNQTPEQQP